MQPFRLYTLRLIYSRFNKCDNITIIHRHKYKSNSLIRPLGRDHQCTKFYSTSADSNAASGDGSDCSNNKDTKPNSLPPGIKPFEEIPGPKAIPGLGTIPLYLPFIGM